MTAAVFQRKHFRLIAEGKLIIDKLRSDGARMLLLGTLEIDHLDA